MKKRNSIIGFWLIVLTIIGLYYLPIIKAKTIINYTNYKFKKPIIIFENNTSNNTQKNESFIDYNNTFRIYSKKRLVLKREYNKIKRYENTDNESIIIQELEVDLITKQMTADKQTRDLSNLKSIKNDYDLYLEILKNHYSVNWNDDKDEVKSKVYFNTIQKTIFYSLNVDKIRVFEKNKAILLETHKTNILYIWNHDYTMAIQIVFSGSFKKDDLYYIIENSKFI